MSALSFLIVSAEVMESYISFVPTRLSKTLIEGMLKRREILKMSENSSEMWMIDEITKHGRWEVGRATTAAPPFFPLTK